ncbi:hypothetical protein, partial [Xylanibacter muris]|uniref:hypothetical protein n=1 Tax=Xylanibacter muris TaxID=2736290 RepID=UPI0025A2C1E8
ACAAPKLVISARMPLVISVAGKGSTSKIYRYWLEIRASGTRQVIVQSAVSRWFPQRYKK